MRSYIVGFVVAGLVFACGSTGEVDGTTADELRVTESFVSDGTGYYPDSSAMEGGFVDMRGKKLRTLQQFLNGDAEYVSVAMDPRVFRYGQRLRIREFNTRYGREIVFRVVDTGGAFRGRGRGRMDLCVQNRAASLDRTVSGTLHVDVIDESGDAPEPAPPQPSPGGTSDITCSTDGDCNPGNDGSGKICQNGACVTGCHSNAQCPGSTRCSAGLCR
ncbi:MAG: hypothetical protein HOO96_12010 [Polyangiaceae bacterium]|nr:hypothetical protein [Polyangiaceae bacterium]